MTDHEAMLALVAPEPEIWEKGLPARTSTAGLIAWDTWNRRRVEAINHAKEASNV